MSEKHHMLVWKVGEQYVAPSIMRGTETMLVDHVSEALMLDEREAYVWLDAALKSGGGGLGLDIDESQLELREVTIIVGPKVDPPPPKPQQLDFEEEMKNRAFNLMKELNDGFQAFVLCREIEDPERRKQAEDKAADKLKRVSDEVKSWLEMHGFPV